MLNAVFRPPTSCADMGTQCDIIDEDEKHASLDNPLSDSSTWNTELPNIGKDFLVLFSRCSNNCLTADVQLCSSPELMFDCEKHYKGDEVNDTLVEHLSQQLESCKSDLAAKMDYIVTLEDDLAVKNDVIKDQGETINDYREEILRMEESMYEPRDCPVLEQQRRQRRLSRRHRKRRTPRSMMLPCPRDSVDTDEWSEPETGVSIARIGLPHSYPELVGACSCERNILFSDCEEKSSKI